MDMPEVIDDKMLPYAFVWLGNEDIAATSLGTPSHGSRLDRDLQIFVDLIARDGKRETERVEELAGRIETALSVDATLGGLVRYQLLRAYTFDRDDSGGSWLIRLRMQFDASYSTETGRPTVAV